MPGNTPAAVSKVAVLAAVSSLSFVAPALATLAGPMPQILLAALGAAGIEIGVDQFTKLIEGRKQRARPTAGALLRNHDLEVLALHALDTAAERDLGRTRSGSTARRKLLEDLRAAVERELRSEQPTELPVVADGEILGMLTGLHGPNARSAAPELGETVATLLQACGTPHDDASITAAAHRLTEPFQSAVVELLKRDVNGEGPAEGRAYAALTLRFQGAVLATLQALRAGHEADTDRVKALLGELNDSQIRQIWAAEHQLQLSIEESVAQLRDQLSEHHAELVGRLARIDERLLEIAETLRGLYGSRLEPLATFASRYWSIARTYDYGLDDLWAEASTASALQETFLGRHGELEKVRGLLAEDKIRVHVWRGPPGTGKTRFALAAADLARGEGWHVLFVTAGDNSFTDAAMASLHRLRASGPRGHSGASFRCLVVWDDYKGSQPERMGAFLDLPWTWEGDFALRCLVTTWPTHDVLGERRHQRERYSEFAFEPVHDPGSVAEYLRRIAAASPRAAAALRRNDALAAVALASEGHFEAALRGLALALQPGVPIPQTSAELLANSYSRAIERVARSAAGADLDGQRLRVLRILAYVGHAEPEALPPDLRDVAWQLSEVRFLAHERANEGEPGLFVMRPDGLRVHIVRESLHPPGVASTRLSWQGRFHDDPIRALAPFALSALPLIWSITHLVTEEPLRSRAESLREELADHVRDCGRHVDAQVGALRHAAALRFTTIVEPDPAARMRLADRIAALRAAGHDTEEIALEEAKALFNATVGEPDPAARLRLADRIAALRAADHDTDEVALQEANALNNATVVEPDPAVRVRLADRIAALRAAGHDTEEIALEEAKALFNATVGEPDPAARLRLADRIAALRAADHDTDEVALQEANALNNATVVEPDPAVRVRLADRIAALRAAGHDTDEVALNEAKALFNATVVEPDPAACLRLTDRIAALRAAGRDTDEIALREAKALFNATVGEPDPAARLRLADRIAALRAADHDTDEVALNEAKALFNATVVEPDPAARLRLADRIAALRAADHDTDEVALNEAKALFNATANEPDPAACLRLADRIAVLRAAGHDTDELALEEATALFNATVVEPDRAACLRLADRIAALRAAGHDTDEIALQEAKALINVTANEPDPAARLRLADRVAALRAAGHDTDEIALEEAKALFNATVVEPDPAACLRLADRVAALRAADHDTDEVALNEAKALFNATVVEPDPAARLRLADRIAALRAAGHDADEITALEAEAR